MLRSIGMSSTSDMKTGSAFLVTLTFLVIAISNGRSSTVLGVIECIMWQFGKPLIL